MKRPRSEADLALVNERMKKAPIGAMSARQMDKVIDRVITGPRHPRGYWFVGGRLVPRE